MSRPSPQPALDALCAIATEAGAHVELHVSGQLTSKDTYRRKLLGLRVARDHHTLVQARLPKDSRVGVELAAMTCIEELAKTA